MGLVLMLSGPIGAGKSTVAQELVTLWAGPLVSIEGDTFWPFLVKRKEKDRREDFRLIMRSMTASAVPFARAGYDVLLDFSIPPAFLKTARAILKEIPLAFVMLRPRLAVCADRALRRLEGRTTHYDQGFYDLFAGIDTHTISEEEADPKSLATKILMDLESGQFRVGE